MCGIEGRRALGQRFDVAAEAYDAARSGYPARLVDRAIDRGGLTTGSRVLEIGCGSGKLTDALVARGFRIDAIDPGPNMLAIAQRRFREMGAITFHLGRFEEVEFPEEAFDGVFSATAFHWVDPAVGWAKAARHLKAGALLALLSHINVRNERAGPVQDEFVTLLRKYAPEVARKWRQFLELDVLMTGAEERRANPSEVWDWLLQGGLERPTLTVAEAATLYEDVETTSEAYTVEMTADESLALFRTTALYHRLDPVQRQRLEEHERRMIERLGGTVCSAGAVVLMTARRSPRRL